jgi:hypothetical protein
MATPARPSRRGLLLGGAAGSAGLAGLALGARGLFNPPATGHEYGTPNIIQVGSHGGRGGGVQGATFRHGGTIDHAANGFHPSEFLRDFDYGTTSRLLDGRMLREWEIFASEKDVEVAPTAAAPTIRDPPELATPRRPLEAPPSRG